MADGALSPRAETFAAGVARGLDGAAAAREAGYSSKRAKVTASELLDDPRVQARIQEIRDRAAAAVLEQLPASNAGRPTSDVHPLPASPAIVTGADRAQLVDGAAAELAGRIRDRLAGIALTPLTELIQYDERGDVRMTPSAQLSPAAAASLKKVKATIKEVIVDGEAEQPDKLLRVTELELEQHAPVPAAKEVLELLGAYPKKDPAAGGAGLGILLVVAGGPTGLELPAAQPAAAPVAVVAAPAAPVAKDDHPPAARPWRPRGRAIVVAPLPQEPES